MILQTDTRDNYLLKSQVVHFYNMCSPDDIQRSPADGVYSSPRVRRWRHHTGAARNIAQGGGDTSDRRKNVSVTVHYLPT